MNIGGIGSPGVDYSRYATEQRTQKQEASEQQAEQTVTVQQTEQPQETGTNAGSNTTAQSGTSAVAEMSGQLAETLKTSDDDDDDSDQTLINKANAGSALTQSELSRLKEADPGLYSRVVKAEKAREELRSQMKENPSGAKQAVQSAISKNNSEEQEIVRKALSDEYSNFASKYDQVELSGKVMR